MEQHQISQTYEIAAEAIKNAIFQAIKFANSNINKVIEEELYNKTNKLLYNSIVKNKWIVFDDYKLKVKEFKNKNEN